MCDVCAYVPLCLGCVCGICGCLRLHLCRLASLSGHTTHLVACFLAWTWTCRIFHGYPGKSRAYFLRASALWCVARSGQPSLLDPSQPAHRASPSPQHTYTHVHTHHRLLLRLCEQKPHLDTLLAAEGTSFAREAMCAAAVGTPGSVGLQVGRAALLELDGP